MLEFEIDFLEVKKAVKEIEEIKKEAIRRKYFVPTDERASLEELLNIEIVLRLLRTLSVNGIPSTIEKVSVIGDSIRVEPEKGVGYTINGFEYILPLEDGRYTESSLWELISNGYSVVNPAEKTKMKVILEEDGKEAEVLTKRGLTVMSTLDDLDVEEIFDKVSARANLREPTIIRVFDDDSYLQVSVSRTNSHAYIGIKKDSNRVIVFNWIGDSLRILRTIIVPILKTVNLNTKDIVSDMINFLNSYTELTDETVYVI